MGVELIARKIGMTQLFDVSGNFVGVTVLECGPCTVLQKKTVKTDGYEAYQLGFGQKKAKNATKAMVGHAAKANVPAPRVVKEFRVETPVELAVGDKVTVKEFAAGQFVDVIGVSKGKGFQGVMRRHKFGGGPATHGHKGWHRRGGAIGQRLFPGRVFRGMRMPGHMGDKKITTQNLRVIQVRDAENLLLVEGAVPGAKGSIVFVRHAKKKPRPAAKTT
jgi:large subunit ribosomal protein L3